MRRPPPITEYARYPVVAGVAVLSIAVTVAWWAGMNVAPLLETAMIRRGELWRLLTCIFLHGNVFHLAFNVYWLWVFGTLVEEEFGHWKTAAFILFFAIGSSAMEFAFLVGGIGLSGVGYGLFGMLWMLAKYGEPRFHDAIDPMTVQIFIAWFFVCIVTTYFHYMMVANIAHGAGLVLGVLVGLAIAHEEERAAAAAGAAFVFLFSLWAATLGRPWINVSSTRGAEEGQWGYTALVENHDEEAAKWFRDATRYQPKEPAYWFDLGIALERLGKRSEAHAAYQKAAQLDPSDSQFSAAADATK